MTDPVTLPGIVKTGVWGVNRTEVQPFLTTANEHAIADFLREFQLFRVSAEADETPLWGEAISAHGPQFGCIGANAAGYGVHYYGSLNYDADGTQIVHASLKGTLASESFTLGTFNTVWTAPARWRVFNTSVCNGRAGKPTMVAEIFDTSQNRSRLVFLWAYKHGALFHRMGSAFYNIFGVGCPEIFYDADDDFYYFSYLTSGVTDHANVIYYTIVSRTLDFINFETATKPLLVPPTNTGAGWSAEKWNNSDVGSIVWPSSSQVDFYYTDGNQAVNDTNTGSASPTHDIRHAYYIGTRSDLHRALFA